MKNCAVHCLAVLAFVASCAGVHAASTTLKVGEPAPQLQVRQWVQGEPVKALEKGKIYVIECWATWCGPCRASIPHLSELASQYKDVTFVGVSIWEDDDSKVAPFVKEMGERMTYRVAMDDKTHLKEGTVGTHWMGAAGRTQIPTAFIVDKDTRIIWIGSPFSMDKPLAEIVAGTFDPKVEAARVAAEEAYEAAKDEKVIQLLRAKRYDEALTGVEGLLKANPDRRLDLLRLKSAVLIRKQDFTTVFTILDEMAASKDIDADQLTGMAASVLIDEAFENHRDINRATKWAQMAVDASKGKDPDALETLARAHAMKGDFFKATELQQKAIDAAFSDQKDGLRKTLESYRNKKVPAVE